MNKRAIKRSMGRWFRHHGLGIDTVLSKLGLARLRKVVALEQDVRGLQVIVESYERECGLIDEDALYE